MKVLNLYAGVGGNAYLWDCEVTAVEIDPAIAEIYLEFRPDDEIIIGDAHQYLLENYHSFDFIWSSPPCPSHSRLIRSGKNRKPRFPDMKLYEEIILLMHNCGDNIKYLVENVKSYYEPLYPPRYMGRHAYWSNFTWPDFDEPAKDFDFINGTNMAGRAAMQDWLGMHSDKVVYHNGGHCPAQIWRNAVHPLSGQHILNSALGIAPVTADQSDLFSECELHNSGEVYHDYGC